MSAICGDLDSLRPDVREYYRCNHDTKLVEDKDQYSTDLMKCLKHINSMIPSLNKQWYLDDEAPHEGLDIVILGGLEGRADQAFSQIHHLYAASELRSPRIGKTYLVTAESIIFLLEKGLNRIFTPVGPGQLTENVGIIPIGRPSIMTTRGLEWDVTDWPTEFGTQISTSNHIKKDVVEVETTEEVLFTVELAPKDAEWDKIKRGTPANNGNLAA